MNIFIIPSWYPSDSNPIYGIFNKEQAYLLARERPEFKIGVSKWGQGEEDFLLPALRPSTYLKLFASKKEECVDEVQPNLTEYFSPAFTWTRKFRKGNLAGIQKANESNLAKHIEKYGKPDLICAQASYPASLIAKRMSERLGIPYTVTIYMSPFPFKEFVDRDGKLNKLIYEPLVSAKRLLSSCTALSDRMKQFGLSNTSLVPLPVDTDFFVPGEKHASDKMVILSVGRIEEQKGFDLLLEAVSQIDSPFELRIGGYGSLMIEYKKIADQLGLKDKVVWLGLLSKDQVRQEMQNCSFYVLSSRHETFGIVQVEAMSCGKPVVATKCGGPEDVITNENGYLVENLDVDDLSEKILEMMLNYQSFSSSRIREVVISRFGQKSWVSRVEAIFRGLI